MNCSTCGSQIPDGSTMCGVCGAAIQAQPNMQYQQPQYQQPMQQQYQQSQFQQPQYQQPMQQYQQPQYQQPTQQNMYAQPTMQPMNMAVTGASSMTAKPSLNIGNIILWVGCLITAISVFLNYVTASVYGYSQSTNLLGTNGEFKDGFIILTGIVIIAILNAFKFNIPNIVLSVLELGIAFLEKKSIDDNLTDPMITIQYGPGFYLLWVGTAVMIIGAITALVIKAQKK